MADFDDYFAKKLDEERSFPRRERNWRIIRKRLDARDPKAGPLSFSAMRVWKIAATVLLLVTGWLAWALVAERRENAALHRQMATAAERTVAPSASAPLPGGEKTPSGTGRSGEQTALPDPATTGASKSPSRKGGENGPKQIPEAGNNLDAHGNRSSIAEQAASADNQTDTQNALAGNETAPAEGDLPSREGEFFERKTDSTRTKAVPGRMPEVIAERDAARQETNSGADSTAANNTPPAEIIKPAPGRSRLRAGIHVLAGVPLPREKGVSLLTGQGLRAEFALTKNLWLTASADWLRLEVSAGRVVPQLHHHGHDPDTLHGSPQSKLVKVESAQRRQQFGAGLRYALPARGWLKPSVRAAYSRARISPETVSLRFEKPAKNDPPEFIVHKYEARQLDIFCVGIGVERETPHWVFGLWADYSRNFARPDAGFDALSMEGGLLYRFN